MFAARFRRPRGSRIADQPGLRSRLQPRQHRDDNAPDDTLTVEMGLRPKEPLIGPNGFIESDNKMVPDGVPCPAVVAGVCPMENVG
jgi:hypothetical protein